MRYNLSFAFLSFAFLSFAVSPVAAQECQYGSAYGTVYDFETGQEIDVTADTLPAFLSDLNACIESAIGDEKVALPFDSDAISGLSPTARFFAAFPQQPRSSLIKEQIELAWRLVDMAGIARSDIEAEAAVAGFRAVRLRSPTPHLVEAYIENCRNNGVPVPGPIGGDDWSEQIIITDETVLVATNAQFMSILLHGIDDSGTSTSEGFCVAFLRKLERETPIGTICMNEERSKACFFDNMKYEAGTGEPVRMDVEETLDSEFRNMALVSDSEDACVACHVGDNPLIIHPGTTLSRIFGFGRKDDDFHFVPFGEGDWCNPKPVESNTGCNRCHDIAQSGKGSRYCALLRKAANETMPLSRTSAHKHIKLWPDEDGNFKPNAMVFEHYFPSLRELRQMCKSSGGLTGTCEN